MRSFLVSASASSALLAALASSALGAGRAAPPSFSVEPSTVVAGRTLAVYCRSARPLADGRARLNGREALFYPVADGLQRALLGVGAAQRAGVSTVTISGIMRGNPVEAAVAVRVKDGRYPLSRIRLSPDKDALYTSGAVARDSERLAAYFTQPGDPQKLWDGAFLWPSTGIITTVFGARRSYGGRPPSSPHSGLDLANKEGTLIAAPAAGRVVFSGWLESFGQTVLLDHGQGVYSYYLHMKAASVAAGSLVRPGDALGLMGREGVATGPHLHWSLAVAGERVDPAEWTERAVP